MDCSPPGFTLHGTLQARILEHVAIFFPRGSSQSRDGTWVFCVSCIGRQVFFLPLVLPGKPKMLDVYLKDDSYMFSHSTVPDFLWPPWTVAHQASLSIGFSRQEYQSVLPCSTPGDLPDPGSNSHPLNWQADFYSAELPGKLPNVDSGGHCIHANDICA